MSKHTIGVAVIGLALSAMVALAPKASIAQDQAPAANTGKFGIEYKLEYRPSRPAYNAPMENARPILDQMIANKGPDDYLKNYGWDRFANQVDWATYYLKNGSAQFDGIYRSMTKERDQVEARANAIQKAHDDVAALLGDQQKEWDALLAGDDKVSEYLMKAAGSKLGGIGLSKLLQGVGEALVKKGIPGGSVPTAAGKVLGPVSTIYSLYQFFQAYAEYADMKLMLDDMLEMVEVKAYLQVLLRQYDDLLNAQDDIIGRLELAAATIKPECR